MACQLCCTELLVPAERCQSLIFSEVCGHKSKALLTGQKQPTASLRPGLGMFSLSSQGRGQRILQHKNQLYRYRVLVFSKEKTPDFKPAKHQSLKAQVAPRSPKLEGQRPGDLLLSSGRINSNGTSRFSRASPKPSLGSLVTPYRFPFQKGRVENRTYSKCSSAPRTVLCG